MKTESRDRDRDNGSLGGTQEDGGEAAWVAAHVSLWREAPWTAAHFGCHSEDDELAAHERHVARRRRMSILQKE